MQQKPTPFANTSEFYTALGCFYAAWSRTELALDFATWKALGTDTQEQAHERSARTKFSDKCKQFRALIDAGKISNGEKVKELVGKIEHHSMRNVFAHSFLASNERTVMFVHRKVGRGKNGKYEPLMYKFSRGDFLDHVLNFVQLSFDFEQTMGLSHREVAEFAAMALPLTPEEAPTA